jgi:TolB-like protein/Flp pilus assembly protein TadD
MARSEVTRRLTTIVAADVVGYSRLTSADEEGTFSALRRHRNELIDPKIAEYKGRIANTAGDSLLIEFQSVIDALRCMIDVQHGMAKRNADVAENRRITFRIGINLGDVIEHDGDLFGDGVNVAARLEGLAEPGGICISRATRDQVRDRIDIALEDLGEVEVKNIPRPVRCFAIRLGDDWQNFPVASAERGPSTKLSQKPSVAVLPFDNMSRDPDQDFFADGMAEDIITALSKLHWFFVIARNSTFAYKGRSVDVRQVARELGVRYVLEGSVRKAGDRMRIAAQLIDGASGNHLWAERYDRQVTDIFAVQDDITQNVVGAIQPQLLAAEHLRIQSEPPESLDAWGCVIRGLWHLGRSTKEDNDQARLLLQQAVALSPGYAKAHSVLAFAEAREVLFGGDIGETLAKAFQIAQTAISLDEDDPWGYFSAGYIVCFTSKYDEAIIWYRRAIELNENFALAHGNIAAALALGGHPDEAIEAVDLALRMSPRDPFNFAYLHFAAIAHFAAERYADGIACEEQALRERPNLSPALRFLAACHICLDEKEQARRAIAEVLKLAPESAIKRDVYGHVAYARESDRERYAQALREAGLPEE